MNSTWGSEIAAVIIKEARCELRARSGLVSAFLFSVLAVVTVGFAAFGLKLGGGLAAGLLWVALLFAAVVALPRAFVLEEEQGTADLLRLVSRPHAVFWGKLLFNLVQILANGLVLAVLFVALLDLTVAHPLLFVASLVAGCMSLAGAVTFCGALVAQAANRAALVGVVALPLLLPLVALGVGSMRAALGEGTMVGSVSSLGGLFAYSAMALAGGPYLFAAVWKH